VYIATLSPCKKDIDETRVTLNTAVDLSLQLSSGSVVLPHSGNGNGGLQSPEARTALRSTIGTPASLTPLRSAPSSATGVRSSRPSRTPDTPLVTLAENPVPFEKRVAPLASSSSSSSSSSAKEQRKDIHTVGSHNVDNKTTISPKKRRMSTTTTASLNRPLAIISL